MIVKQQKGSDLRDFTTWGISSQSSAYREIFDAIATGILLYAPDGHLIDVNPAACRMYQRTREEMIELDPPGWIAPELRLTFPALLEATDAGLPFCLDSQALLPDGTSFEVEVRGALVVIDGKTCLLANVIDISDIKQAQEALIKSEARYRALTEFSRDLIVEFSLDRTVTFLSPASRSLLGRDPEDYVNSLAAWEVLLHPEDYQAAAEAFRDALQSAPRGAPTLLRMRHADGHWVWTEVLADRYVTGSGETRIVASFRDVSERVRLREERELYASHLESEVARRTRELAEANRNLRELQTRVVQAERLGAAEELAGSVAHAINNPLAALLGTAEMALEGDSTPEMERVLMLAQRVDAVVTRTLALYRKGATRRTPEDASELLEEVLDGLSERALSQAVAVEVKSGHRLPQINVDRPLVTAALSGVASNALDAMPDGGSLLLSVEVLASPRVVRFIISDTGPGIPEVLRERVFEPFFTTKGGGTGLGLAIAKGAIQGHEGRVSVETSVGGGAAVVIELPIEGTEVAGE